MGSRVPRWLAALTLAAACGGRAGPEHQIADDLGRQLGAPVERLRCPGGTYPKTCAAVVAGGEELAVTVTEGAGGLEWSLDGFVISTAPLAAAVGDALDELGLAADVDCAPTIRSAQVGDRVQCQLHGGVEGAAWGRLVDDEGRFELELALDPAAVAARTVPTDDAELEARSRALDVDEPDGEDDDGEDGDDDALDGGVAPPDAAHPSRTGT